MRVEDLGSGVLYEASHARQKELLAARIAGEVEDTLLVVEHAPVITLGRRRTSADNVLNAGDIPVVQAERGGDVTWHGPGQLVVYPIVALPPGRQDLHRHLSDLEEACIRTCADLGLQAGRDPRNTGCWIDGRKVASVGIGCRRWVTWHGLALNIDPDLSAFERINPCGFDADVMTSLAAHGVHATRQDVRDRLVAHLIERLPG